MIEEWLKSIIRYDRIGRWVTGHLLLRLEYRGCSNLKSGILCGGIPEGLKVPKKQPKRGRLWLNDGSCVRLRPEYKDHVWSYDYKPL